MAIPNRVIYEQLQLSRLVGRPNQYLLTCVLDILNDMSHCPLA